MNRLIRSRNPLALAIAASLAPMMMLAMPVVAQTSTPSTPQTTTQSALPAGGSTATQSKEKEEKKAKPQTLQAIVVTGVRESQMKSVQLKRDASFIEDSITSENIGELPDITIADSLQRVTGVQIDRTAGVGSSVNVRGLPQVATLLNGEVLITADNIVSPQPDFTTLPAQLFDRVDVIKSPTASLLNSGISGTIDLRTRRPWDLPSGWTLSGTAQGARGSVTRKNQPDVSGLIGYNDGGHWGALFSAAYSDITRDNSTTGLGQYGAVIDGENAESAEGSYGFLGAFNGAPIPSQIHQLGGGNVDVNGDGKSDGAFLGSENFTIHNQALEHENLSLNGTLQFDLGSGLTLTADEFFSRDKQHNRNIGSEFNSTNWQGATFVPLQSRNTGVSVNGPYNGGGYWSQNQTLYTTQVYQKWLGDFETYTSNDVTNSIAKNFSLALDYDNGGPFTGSVRGIASSAHQLFMTGYVQFTDADGAAWPNSPLDAAPPGTYVYPAQLGGDRVFNPNGFPQNTIPVTFYMLPNPMAIAMPSELSQFLTGRNNLVLKTMTSENDYDRSSTMNVFRADGHFKFSDDLKLDFGIRNSIRSASNFGFQLNAPVYGGMGASDPAGCMVHYYAADVVLDGAGIDGACTAGNAQGFYRAGVLSGKNASELPPLINSNFRLYENLGGVAGMNTYDLDPKAMDNIFGFFNALYPGQVRQFNPGTTWKVRLKETTAYLQADFGGTLGVPYSGNVGVRVIRTDLDVTQHLTGDAEPYGLLSADAGTHLTARQYQDVLPAANLAFDLTPSLKLRLAYSKNMMPLDLSTWGGGLTLNYAIDTSNPNQTIFRVVGGSSDGNPALKPWRSTNYDLSLEYYMGPESVISLAAFDMRIASFISSGSVTNCTLPDQDGVVRGHCVAIFEPIQGTGNTLHGVEFDYRQGFSFLPGLWRNTGVEFNYTYSPSDSGEKDLAGNAIPFQDNSKQQGNLILWYQDSKFQARVAGNYRTKRAVSQNFGGINGLEEYQKATFYLDASVSYNITPKVQIFLQGSNLTGEHERYYLVWSDQVVNSVDFEKRYLVGVRATF